MHLASTAQRPISKAAQASQPFNTSILFSQSIASFGWPERYSSSRCTASALITDDFSRAISVLRVRTSCLGGLTYPNRTKVSPVLLPILVTILTQGDRLWCRRSQRAGIVIVTMLTSLKLCRRHADNSTQCRAALATYIAQPTLSPHLQSNLSSPLLDSESHSHSFRTSMARKATIFSSLIYMYRLTSSRRKTTTTIIF